MVMVNLVPIVWQESMCFVAPTRRLGSDAFWNPF